MLWKAGSHRAFDALKNGGLIFEEMESKWRDFNWWVLRLVRQKPAVFVFYFNQKIQRTRDTEWRGMFVREGVIVFKKKKATFSGAVTLGLRCSPEEVHPTAPRPKRTSVDARARVSDYQSAELRAPVCLDPQANLDH
jgi:hypothetical protein